MTTVADEKKISDEDLARVARVWHDVEERLLCGSLDPNDLVRVLTHLTGKGARAVNLIEYSGENCPKINWTHLLGPKAKRAKKGVTPVFDEVAYFQIRPGLWVDPDLQRYVGLQVRPTRPHAALKRRPLSKSEREDVMFGELGSSEHEQAISNACDLSQIGGKIEAQKNGEDGELLTDGSANIFPVRGLDGALLVVYVDWLSDDRRWDVHCRPFRSDRVWLAGYRVFSN